VYTHTHTHTTECNVPVVSTSLRAREVRRSNGGPETGHHLNFFLWFSLVIADVGTVHYTRPTPFPHLLGPLAKLRRAIVSQVVPACPQGTAWLALVGFS